MSQEIPSHAGFTPEAFEVEITGLANAWRSTWNVSDSIRGPVLHGPTIINGSFRPFMTAEQVAAEQPEIDAYHNFVNGVARGVVAATRSGQQDVAVDRLLKIT